MKVITICGSLKFKKEMIYYAEKLALEGNCVLSVIYTMKENYTKDELHHLEIGHIKKIEISDAIFVVNKNGNIGEAVRKEIDYAKNSNKEIMYLENNNNGNNEK
jgi:predicted mannosyl-3-phosphoglycerate phosphatase (HAD superfamily)